MTSSSSQFPVDSSCASSLSAQDDLQNIPFDSEFTPLVTTGIQEATQQVTGSGIEPAREFCANCTPLLAQALTEIFTPQLPVVDVVGEGVPIDASIATPESRQVGPYLSATSAFSRTLLRSLGFSR